MQDLKDICSLMKSKNKELRQIRYDFYMKWAVGLRKSEFGMNIIDNTEPCYLYPTLVLDDARHIVPGNLIGEFREVYSL